MVKELFSLHEGGNEHLAMGQGPGWLRSFPPAYKTGGGDSGGEDTADETFERDEDTEEDQDGEYNPGGGQSSGSGDSGGASEDRPPTLGEVATAAAAHRAGNLSAEELNRIIDRYFDSDVPPVIQQSLDEQIDRYSGSPSGGVPAQPAAQSYSPDARRDARQEEEAEMRQRDRDDRDKRDSDAPEEGEESPLLLADAPPMSRKEIYAQIGRLREEGATSEELRQAVDAYNAQAEPGDQVGLIHRTWYAVDGSTYTTHHGLGLTSKSHADKLKAEQRRSWERSQEERLQRLRVDDKLSGLAHNAALADFYSGEIDRDELESRRAEYQEGTADEARARINEWRAQGQPTVDRSEEPLSGTGETDTDGETPPARGTKADAELAQRQLESGDITEEEAADRITAFVLQRDGTPDTDGDDTPSTPPLERGTRADAMLAEEQLERGEIAEEEARERITAYVLGGQLDTGVEQTGPEPLTADGRARMEELEGKLPDIPPVAGVDLAKAYTHLYDQEITPQDYEDLSQQFVDNYTEGEAVTEDTLLKAAEARNNEQITSHEYRAIEQAYRDQGAVQTDLSRLDTSDLSMLKDWGEAAGVELGIDRSEARGSNRRLRRQARREEAANPLTPEAEEALDRIRERAEADPDNVAAQQELRRALELTEMPAQRELRLRGEQLHLAEASQKSRWEIKVYGRRRRGLTDQGLSPELGRQLEAARAKRLHREMYEAAGIEPPDDVGMTAEEAVRANEAAATFEAIAGRADPDSEMGRALARIAAEQRVRDREAALAKKEEHDRAGVAFDPTDYGWDADILESAAAEVSGELGATGAPDETVSRDAGLSIAELWERDKDIVNEKLPESATTQDRLAKAARVRELAEVWEQRGTVSASGVPMGDRLKELADTIEREADTAEALARDMAEVNRPIAKTAAPVEFQRKAERIREIAEEWAERGTVDSKSGRPMADILQEHAEQYDRIAQQMYDQPAGADPMAIRAGGGNLRLKPEWVDAQLTQAEAMGIPIEDLTTEERESTALMVAEEQRRRYERWKRDQLDEAERMGIPIEDLTLDEEDTLARAVVQERVRRYQTFRDQQIDRLESMGVGIEDLSDQELETAALGVAREPIVTRTVRTTPGYDPADLLDASGMDLAAESRGANLERAIAERAEITDASGMDLAVEARLLQEARRAERAEEAAREGAAEADLAEASGLDQAAEVRSTTGPPGSPLVVPAWVREGRPLIRPTTTHNRACGSTGSKWRSTVANRWSTTTTRASPCRMLNPSSRNRQPRG